MNDFELKAHPENVEPIVLPKIQNEKKAVIVKKLRNKNENDSDFKIMPLPKESFKEDRTLGLQADNSKSK